MTTLGSEINDNTLGRDVLEHNGWVYMVGQTDSLFSPNTGPIDAFIARFALTGQLAAFSPFGKAGEDVAVAVYPPGSGSNDLRVFSSAINDKNGTLSTVLNYFNRTDFFGYVPILLESSRNQYLKQVNQLNDSSFLLFTALDNPLGSSKMLTTLTVPGDFTKFSLDEMQQVGWSSPGSSEIRDMVGNYVLMNFYNFW
ncbi:MAG: hypothetical protein HC842_08470 [Cytophagales bacterium]|nr:hypothetical protein [Cytophagales bacterium]